MHLLNIDNKKKIIFVINETVKVCQHTDNELEILGVFNNHIQLKQSYTAKM